MAYTEARAPGRPFVSYQPLSRIYRLIYISSIVARLPFWVLSFALIRRWRKHPTWTLKQTLLNRLAKELLHVTSRSEKPERLTLEPGKEKERFEKIEPFPANLYRGPLDEDTVKPATIGGTWFPTRPHWNHRETDSTVVLHFHGGAYVIGNGRSDQLGFLSSRLLKYANVDAVFSPQYRLACRPDPAPFPAALQDALTSYLYLVRTEGISASNITLSGDSAGGNLVIAFLRYLAEFGAQLDIPPPRNAVLISPWVAPVKGLWPEICTTSNPHFRTDYIAHTFLQWGAKEISRIVPATDPYISCLGHPFATPVPMFVNIGAAEILEIDDTQWVREMGRVEGNVVEVNYEAAAPHDTLLLGAVLGWEKSAQGVAELIGVFIRKNSRE